MSTGHHSPDRNFVALGGGEAIGRLVAFGTTLFLARRFGPEGYGVIAFAAGVTLYFGKLAEFALDYVGVAAVAGARDAVGRLGSALLTARVLATALLVTVGVGLVQLLLPDPERTVLSLYFLTLLPVAANPKWILIGLHDARAVGAVRVAGELLALALVVAVVRAGTELWAAPMALAVAEGLGVVALVVVVGRLGHRLRPLLAPELVAPVARRAAPVVALGLLGLVIYNSDLIFLRVLRDPAAVGQYAAAYTLIGFLANLGLAFAMTLIPGLTRLEGDAAGQRTLYARSLALCYAVALPMAAGGWILAERVIALGFGPGYDAAGAALAILVWSIPLSALRNVPLAALVARNGQRLLLKATAIAVVGNLVLNLILIPPFGIAGAAVATVATECLAGLLTLAYAARDGLGWVTPRRLWRATVATAVMAGVLWVAAEGLPLAGAIVAGVAAYALALTAVGGIRWRRGAVPDLDL